MDINELIREDDKVQGLDLEGRIYRDRCKYVADICGSSLLIASIFQ